MGKINLYVIFDSNTVFFTLISKLSTGMKRVRPALSGNVVHKTRRGSEHPTSATLFVVTWGHAFLKGLLGQGLKLLKKRINETHWHQALPSEMI